MMLTLFATSSALLLPNVPARRAAPRMAADDSCLIIQNKGGGHGEIGYHLAMQLSEQGKVKRKCKHDTPSLRQQHATTE